MEIKDVIAQRIAPLIEKEVRKGTTQGKIAKDMGISAQALSDYKNAKREAEVYQLVQMSNYFGVSIDYLVGKDECKTRDNEQIQQELGLSDAAISTLRRYNFYHGGVFDGVNALLGSPTGHDVAVKIASYVYADFSKAFLREERSGCTIAETGKWLFHATGGNVQTINFPVSLFDEASLRDIAESLKLLKKEMNEHVNPAD